MSQWNIGCLGSLTQNFRVDHVHFMLFVPILFVLGNQREPSLQWNMDFRFKSLSLNKHRGVIHPESLPYKY